MNTLGVVVVTYNAADVIRDCLETLLASKHPMRVVVVDNASTDTTLRTIANWKSGVDGYAPTDVPFPCSNLPKPLAQNAIEILPARKNAGFAAGVNMGIRHLLKHQDIDRIWVLNPDTMIPSETPKRFAIAPAGFGLMGGRILYATPPHHIQIDAGTINRWTGVTGNLNLGQGRKTLLPKEAQIQFISGASMVASRPFIEQAGPMPENYFLYYEEVDWALRSTLPLRLCEGAEIYHRAGSSIGSPTLAQPPSPLSAYYKHRARMMYLKNHHPYALPTGYLYGLAKAAQSVTCGHQAQARAIVRALHGFKASTDITAQLGHQPIKSGP